MEADLSIYLVIHLLCSLCLFAYRLPDILFPDSKDIVFPSDMETITIRPNGVMFWSRHTVVTLQQPDFGKYVFIYYLSFIVHCLLLTVLL